MIEHDNITPPPSLADILSGGEDLIGRVDFGSRLVPAAEASGDTVTEPRTRTPRVASKPVVPKPIGPPAAEPEATEPAPLRPTLKRVAAPAVEDVPVDEAPEPAAETGTDRVELADHAEHLDVEQLDEDLRPEPESFIEPAPGPMSYVDAHPAPGRRQPPGLTAPSTVPEHDVAYLGLSVEEVAESARARMRTAELAHLRHLEAIEDEAARRLELLTAQAELDAELIRLHARREAHAIITAARTRTGAGSSPTRAERRLADVGGSFSRFAETLESSIESSATPDHRRRP